MENNTMNKQVPITQHDFTYYKAQLKPTVRFYTQSPKPLSFSLDLHSKILPFFKINI